MRRFFLQALLLLLLFCQPGLAQTDFPSPEAVAPTTATPSARPFVLDEQDEEVTGRLRDIFGQVPGLSGITVEVRGGVAVLRGEVLSLEASVQAAELAQKLEGVVAVDNGVQVASNLQQRISPALSKLYQKGSTFLSFLPLFGIAIMVVLIFLWLGRRVARWDWLFARFSDNVFVTDLLRHVAHLAVAALGFLIALELLEATALVGAVLGTAGVLGVAIGFAFQDMAENSLASILLSLRQPFAPNDLVTIDGQQGKVVRLTSRATILLTLDGNHLRIPNATVFKATILNFTRNPERRFTFAVGIDTEEQIPRAQALAVRTLARCPGVLSEPPPACVVETLGDSTVNLTLVGWVDQRASDFVKARSEAIRRLKEAFDEAHIIMPEPIYKVRMEQTERRQPAPPRSPSPASEVPSSSDDVAPERHLEERISEERQGDQPDLLGQAGNLE